MSESFDIGDADQLAVGAVGEPGERVFLIQARRGAEVVTLKVEKQQVSALAKTLGRLLHSLPAADDVPPAPDVDGALDPDFVVGSLGISYDEQADRVVIVADELVPEEEEPATARIGASRGQVAAFAIAGQRLVESGRPPCPLCGYPLDPRGHVCPRTNGLRPPTP